MRLDMCIERRIKPDHLNAESEQLAVLIVSCDRYKDMWPLCTSMIRRFWPDCPHSIYLMSNKPAQIAGFTTFPLAPISDGRRI